MGGSDLGQDTGTATINATSKAVELFLALLGKIYEAAMKAGDPKLKLEKAKYKDYKREKAQEEAGRKLDVMGGYVALKKLQKSGEPLEVINLKGMDSKDMERFSELCEQEGIVFSGAMKERDDGKADLNLVVRAKDLKRVKDITERMNDEKRIDAIDKRIAEIWKKPEVTDQDIANIKDLQRQKAEIQRKNCMELNSKQAEVIFENAEKMGQDKGVTLSEALDRNTGRSLDKDLHTIIADSHDPSRYIRCHGYMDNYRGKDYIKTDYEVYSGGKQVLSTHDGRFDGRPKDYWNAQKASIMEAGGFTGKVFKFYSESEYQRWAEYANRENRDELSPLKPGERTPEEYERAIESLHQQLKDHDVELDDQGTLVKIVDRDGEEHREPLPNIRDQNISPEEKDGIAECYVIKNQIDVLTQKKAAESELTQAKAYAMVLDDNTPPEQRKVIEEKLSAAEEKLSDLNEKEITLYQQRQEINAVQAERNMNNDREQGKIFEGQDQQDQEAIKMEEANEEMQKSLDEWSETIKEDRQAIEAGGSENMKDVGRAKPGQEVERE